MDSLNGASGLSHRCLPAALVLMAACLTGPAAAETQGAAISQQQVEAAYLYKFGGYVTWPDSAFAAPDSPIVIGVAGSEAVADDLTAMTAGRSIGSRPVVVKRIHEGDPLSGVHILFIGSPGTPVAGALFESSRGRPILVVSEGHAGLTQGGAVSFVVVDDRVRFDVALDAVQANGLKLSALLLSVAHAVSGAAP